MSPISATKSVTSDGWTRLEELGLVGAEEDAGEQVRGDRGEPEATRRQPEDAEHPMVTASSESVIPAHCRGGGHRLPPVAVRQPTTARRRRSSTPGLRIATTWSPGRITVSSPHDLPHAVPHQGDELGALGERDAGDALSRRRRVGRHVQLYELETLAPQLEQLHEAVFRNLVLDKTRGAPTWRRRSA